MIATATRPAQAQTADQSKLAASRKRLTKLRSELNQVFLEREDLINVMLTALIAKTNVFAGGPPGTGKTALSKAIAESFSVKQFYYLVAADTTMDELVGSINLEKLSNENRWEWEIEGGIADAHIAILDEGFKCNSVTLNGLLGLLLDKKIRKGKQKINAPLVSGIVCSNELPQDKSLAPFWDRLSLRCWVEDVSPKSRKVLMLREARIAPQPEITQSFTIDELEQFQAHADSLPVNSNVIDLIEDILKTLQDQNVSISTRKAVQIIGLLRAFAFLKGASQVTEDHLEILTNVLWNKTKDIPEINRVVKEVVKAANSELLDTLQAAKDRVSLLYTHKGDEARYKVYLLSADSKLVEMLKAVETITNNSEDGSNRHDLSLKIRLEIEALRIKEVLEPLASL